jgi:hypothetical protein
MGHPHDHTAVLVDVVGVGDEQPPPNKGIQLPDHRGRQLAAKNPPPGGAAVLIHTDQPQQPRHHLPPAAATGRAGLGERGVSLAG